MKKLLNFSFKSNHKLDKPLLITTFILISFGLVIIYSASSIYSLELYNDGYHFLKKQFLFVILGLGALYFFYKFKYQYLTKLIYALLVINAVMLILTFIPGMGVTAGGATRWLNLGFFRFQPSELTKFLLVIYFAYVINHKKDKIKIFSTGFVPYILVSSIFILLILIQPDFGTAFVLGLVMLIMLFIGGSKKAYIISSLLAVSPLLLYAVTSSSYRLRRITAFLDPWSDPQDSGFQIIQSQLAFYSGGITGKGLGDGQQKLFYLPEAHTDFIFAVVGEELGFLGVGVLLSVYLFLLFRGFLIAFRSKDSLGTLLAFGISSLLGFQITFNIGVVLGVFPTKGIALPFLSYGGSALLITMTMIGVLLNISAQNKTRA